MKKYFDDKALDGLWKRRVAQMLGDDNTMRREAPKHSPKSKTDTTPFDNTQMICDQIIQASVLITTISTII